MNQKQPKPNDVVLGGESPPPVNAAVLGGLTGVKVRLASGSEAVQLSALEDALKYGDEGRQLLGEIFQKESGDRSWNAYHVLWKAIAPEERQLFLSADGRVALPKLAKQGMLQRFGRGLISNFFFLNKDLLLVCATSGAIILEIETGEVLWELDCPNQCSAFSSDRSLLALGDNKHIYLWDIRQGKMLRELETDSTVYSIAIAPNGQFIAAAATTQALDMRVLQLWEIASGTVIARKEKAKFNLAFSPDSKFIAFDREGAICLWNITSNTEVRREDRSFYYQSNFAFSPNGQLLATRGWNGCVRLWNIALKSMGEALWRGERHGNSANGLAFSPDGRFLAAGDRDRAHLWDISSATARPMPSKPHKGLVSAIAFSPNSKFFVSATSDRSICLWYITSQSPSIFQLGHTNPIYSIAISPDSKLLAIGDRCGTIQLWDLASGRKLRLKGSKNQNSSLPDYSLYRDSLVFSFDRKFFAVGRRNMVRLWNIESGKTIQRLEGKTGSIYTISFDADAELLACCNMGAKLQLWNVRAKQPVQRLNRFKGHKHKINIAAFSPDGKLIVTGDDNCLQVWDTQLKKKLKVLDKQLNSWDSLAFSSDNKLLAIAANSKIELVGIASGTLAVWELERLHRVNCLAFTPDGKFLAAGSSDSTVRLFEVPSGKVVKVWEGHSGAVSCVAIAPNGEFLASGSLDGTVRLWQLTITS